jgi:peroxiredoxin family protein
MPPNSLPNRPEKLSLVLYSGDFDKVHYALAMASAAVAVNVPATLFFTMQAIRALKKPGGGKSPGWHALRAGDGRSAREVDEDFGSRGVAHFDELLEACRDLGATFMVCDMGLRAAGLEMADLRDDIDYQEGGLVTFLNDASADGAMLFI